jgi:O-antigen/teichoic acid export membrane protein
MSTARIHTRNLVANWIGFGANLVVMFFLSPFVVHTLGEVAYGIWSLMMIVTGYMGAVDIGTRASTGRYIILYLGQEDHERLGQTVRTSLGLFSILGLLFLAAGIGIGMGFPHFFPSTPEEYHGLVPFLLAAVALKIWLSVVAAVFSGVLVAHDRFDLTRGVDLAVLAVRTAGVVFVLNAGHGLVGLVSVNLLMGVLGLAANYVLARRVYPRLRVWPFTLSKARLKELFSYGIWASIAANAYRIMGQTDLIIVGALIGMSRVTVYSVGAMLIYYSDTILGKISVTFFPPVQRAAGRGDAEEVRWYYLRQLRLALALGIPMYLGYVVFGRLFIGLWMLHPVEFPETSVAGAAAVMTVLSIRKLLYLPAYGGEPLLAAVGRVRFSSIMGITEAAINLGLSIVFVLVLDWGILGVAAGTLAACILVRGWVIPWRAVREAGLRAEAFLKVLGLGLLAAGGFTAWSLLLRTVIVEESWVMFWVQVGLALAGYAPMAFFLLVPPADRKRVFRALRPGNGRLSQGEDGEVELPD